jgi:hypothetical protein
MADDIVKRLRDAEWESVLYELAADEIERLRSEVARLTTRRDELIKEEMRTWFAGKHEADRLRAALERIACFDTVDVSMWNTKAMRDFARAALAGDAKPGMEGNERELEVMGGSVPASAPHRIPEAHDRAGGFKIPPVGEPWNSEDWNAGYEQGFADGRAAPPPPATEGKP